MAILEGGLAAVLAALLATQAPAAPGASLASASAAAAATPTPAAPAPGGHDRQDRPTRDKRAQEAFVAGRYEEALVLLKALYADFPDPIYLRNIGRCHQGLKQPELAIDAFKLHLTLAKDLPKAKRREVEGFIREMEELQRSQAAARARELVATPASPAATGTPPATAPPVAPAPATAPPMAQQQQAPPTPAPRAAEGVAPASPAAPAPAPPLTAATVPPPAAPPPPGDGGAAVADDGGGRRRLMLGLAVAAGALGAVGLIAGSVVGLQAKGKADDSNHYCWDDTCVPRGKDLRDQALDKATLATGLFVAGAALLAAGTVLYLRAPARATTTVAATSGAGARIDAAVPVAAPGGAALTLAGSF